MIFPKWQESHSKGLDRRITYALGPETRLREMIISSLREEASDYVTLRAAEHTDEEIWSELFTHPLRQSQIKLVIVRDAHHIKNWSNLDNWLRNMRTVKCVMESNNALFSVPLEFDQRECVHRHQAKINIKTYQSGKEKRTCSLCDDTEAILTKRGRLVYCVSPCTEAQQRDTITMICNLSSATRKQAEALLEKTNWSVDMALEIVDKLNLLGAPMTETILNSLVLSADSRSFEEALKSGDRSKAASTAHLILESEVPIVLNSLEDWLTKIARVTKSLTSGATTSEIANLIGSSWGYAIKLSEQAAKLDIFSVNKITVALANAQRDWKNNALGVLEVLALQW